MDIYYFNVPMHFYPRPPRGGRHTTLLIFVNSFLFLSTPSARRATLSRRLTILIVSKFLSTPSARRATIILRRCLHCLSKFLSTPSARRATSLTRFLFCDTTNFYPRPPRGGRPPFIQNNFLERGISIHALREEGDRKLNPGKRPSKNFYPRPPRGGRQQKQRQNLYFQTNYTTFCTNLEEP